MSNTAVDLDPFRVGESLDTPILPNDSSHATARTNSNADSWAAELAHDSQSAKCTTIGLISGSRTSTPRGVIDAYARLIAQALNDHGAKRSMLIVRPHVASTSGAREHYPPPPATSVSALGPWSEVVFPVPSARWAASGLGDIPQWLPAWKRTFHFLLVDLGPISAAPSREIGRLCDSCFVLLGPEACGSHEWLLQHIAWHDRRGSTICGTLVTEFFPSSPS